MTKRNLFSIYFLISLAFVVIFHFNMAWGMNEEKTTITTYNVNINSGLSNKKGNIKI